jgi:hypothetical protein
MSERDAAAAVAQNVSEAEQLQIMLAHAAVVPAFLDG